MAGNTNLHSAKKAKNDEFYTQKGDIEAELQHYAEHFRGKVVYCNCDDPVESEFWKFFVRVFNAWGLKKLIATHYEPNEENFSYKLEAVPDENGEVKLDMEPIKTPLPCNGDFRSAACIELLKEADIVVTNPPFSLFREYVAQLMEYNKKFLIIGSRNAITYKEIFPLIKDNRLWLGYGFPKSDAYFRIPPEKACEYAPGVYNAETGLVHFRNCHWFTNLEHEKRHQPLDLRGNYYVGHESEYPTYDNYDAINVDRVANIPIDFNGVMGVPITFLDVYCPEQFEIVAFRKGDDGKDLVFTREREREFNRTFASLFDGSVGPDYGCEADDLQRRKEQVCQDSDTSEDVKFFADYICSHPELIKLVLADRQTDRQNLSRRSSSSTRTAYTSCSSTAKSRSSAYLSGAGEPVLQGEQRLARSGEECRGQGERQNHVCEDYRPSEAIDFFYPLDTAIPGVMNHPRETLVLGKHVYKRILIQKGQFYENRKE